MLQLQVPTNTSRRPTFLQRSSSIASLVAWKERFESYSARFLKEPSFISYTNEDWEVPCKLVREIGTDQYNYGPENDLPPLYPVVIEESPPSFPQAEEQRQQSVGFTQDFTALENYFKKKLSIRNKPGTKRDAKRETMKVFQWMNELPEGDNLEEFLEAYGIPTKGVDMGNLKERLRVVLAERLTGSNDLSTVNENEQPENDTHETQDWKRQLANLEDLAYGDNLENWLESLDVPYFRTIPGTKKEIREYFKLPAEEVKRKSELLITFTESVMPSVPMPNTKEMEDLVPKWKELIEKMGALKTEEDLDKWLENLEVPHNIEKAKVHAEIKKFFRHETFENFAGKSIVLQEHHIAKTLWDKFEDSSLLKQIGMIAGTTAVLGLVAMLSTTMLSFAIPAVFAANPYFVEIFAQFFLQRQEVAFNLLNFHAAHAKPLSTAWAKQYVLWKYC